MDGIIFDTNILRMNNLSRISDTVAKYKAKGKVYIPEVVLDELVHYYEAIFNTELLKFSTLPVFKEYIKDMKSESKNDFCLKIRENIEQIFDRNIIPCLSKECFDEVYKRAISKIPPFNDASKSSDKGFKDTLIWISILEYAKNNGEQNFIFLTKDNGFINQKDALKDDFYRQTSGTIEILSYIEPTTPKNSSTSQILTNTEEQKNNEDIIDIYRSLENFRQDLISSLDNIIFDIDFDNWGQEIRTKRFEISTLIDYGFLYNFKNKFNNILKTNIMNETIDPSDFLFKTDIDCKYKVPLVSLISFYNLIENLEPTAQQYFDSLDKTVVDTINELCYRESSEVDTDFEDLPF